MNNETKKSSAARHTPGPWIFNPQLNYVTGANKHVVCENIGYERNGRVLLTEEQLTNARLIAAAPDMLSALRAIKARINGVWDDKDLRAFGELMADHDQDVLDIVRAAIAKAEGRE